MNIVELWEKANANPGEVVKIGQTVLCDVCGKDCTEDSTSGGFIFGSYAYCPQCAGANLARIRGYDEEHFIRSRCPEGQSFADFVRAYRGEDAGVCISQF